MSKYNLNLFELMKWCNTHNVMVEARHDENGIIVEFDDVESIFEPVQVVECDYDSIDDLEKILCEVVTDIFMERGEKE